MLVKSWLYLKNKQDFDHKHASVTSKPCCAVVHGTRAGLHSLQSDFEIQIFS